MNARIETAFMDELKKIGVKFSEQPTRVIKKHSETKVRKVMAKVRARGKDTSERVKSMYQRYQFGAPSSEQALRSKV
jgi:hypothetical protein